MEKIGIQKLKEAGVKFDLNMTRVSMGEKLISFQGTLIIFNDEEDEHGKSRTFVQKKVIAVESVIDNNCVDDYTIAQDKLINRLVEIVGL